MLFCLEFLIITFYIHNKLVACCIIKWLGFVSLSSWGRRGKGSEMRLVRLIFLFYMFLTFLTGVFETRRSRTAPASYMGISSSPALYSWFSSLLTASGAVVDGFGSWNPAFMRPTRRQTWAPGSQAAHLQPKFLANIIFTEVLLIEWSIFYYYYWLIERLLPYVLKIAMLALAWWYSG